MVPRATPDRSATSFIPMSSSRPAATRSTTASSTRARRSSCAGDMVSVAWGGRGIRAIAAADEAAGPAQSGPGSAQAQHLGRVVAQELGPDLVLEPHVGQLGHDALEGEPHREVAGVDELVGAPGVGVVDDGL